MGLCEQSTYAFFIIFLISSLPCFNISGWWFFAWSIIWSSISFSPQGDFTVHPHSGQVVVFIVPLLIGSPPFRTTPNQRASCSLRVCFTCESIEDCRFVSDDPAVMSWWNVGYISGAEVDFLAIVCSHTQPTWDPDSEMVHLTGICLGEGFDVFWPLPSGLISLLWYRHVTYSDVFYP